MLPPRSTVMKSCTASAPTKLPSPAPEKYQVADAALTLALAARAEESGGRRRIKDPSLDRSAMANEATARALEESSRRRAVILDSAFVAVAEDHGFVPERLAHCVLGSFFSGPDERVSGAGNGTARVPMIIQLDRALAGAIKTCADEAGETVSDCIQGLIFQAAGQNVDRVRDERRRPARAAGRPAKGGAR